MIVVSSNYNRGMRFDPLHDLMGFRPIVYEIAYAPQLVEVVLGNASSSAKLA